MDNGIGYNSLLPVCITYSANENKRSFGVFGKRLLFSFLIVFSFFAFTGFLYSDLNYGVHDGFASFVARLNASGYGELFGQCASAVLFFVLPVALSGVTVFGKITSVLAYSAFAFAAGAVLSCSASLFVDDSLQRYILASLICSAMAVAGLFFCCGVFSFSKRAFAGKRELFLLSPLLSYSVFIIISYSINLLLLFIFCILFKS